ncbi:uncharacterized protein LOC135338050 isoform X3 [Halichondria panicea]|uniref:uncharacterized protein LOC135338050 isoform X3 n=1 Tax=Halichondria panicea TaxID=6063 RepID=UPI00312B34CD
MLIPYSSIKKEHCSYTLSKENKHKSSKLFCIAACKYIIIMAHFPPKNMEDILKSYDVIEVGEFLMNENILSEREFRTIKTLRHKQDITSFLTQMLKGDLCRLEMFRKAMIKFSMDAMYRTISQLSEWSSSLPTTVESECYHDTSKEKDSISQETGYDTEYPTYTMSQQLRNIPKLKHATAQPKPKRSEAVLQAHTSRKERSKSNSVVKITNNYIHVVPQDVSTTTSSRVRPVLLSFRHRHQAGAYCDQLLPRSSGQLKEQNSTDVMLKCFRDLLKECSHELFSSLNVDSLLPHLQKERLVTHEEFQTLIHPSKTSQEKKNFLLSILPSKGENAYEGFLTCLTNADDHSGHSYLVKLLTRLLPSKSVTFV